jgi:hypothetical protein
MARERLPSTSGTELAAGKKKGFVRRSIDWIGEKSTYVTFPVSGVIFLAGVAEASPAMAALGVVGMGTDVIQNRYFRNRRRAAESAA